MNLENIEFDSRVIRDVSHSDLSTLVSIHSLALSHDFLPSLGENTLRRYYSYAFSLQSNNKLKLLGSYEGPTLVGFCVLAFEPTSIAWLLNPFSILRIFLLAFTKPPIFINGFVQWLYSFKSIHCCPEITFFAVTPVRQGLGIGHRLIAAALELCRERNINCLVTKTANHRLSHYYQNTFGAKVVESFNSFDSYYSILKFPI